MNDLPHVKGLPEITKTLEGVASKVQKKLLKGAVNLGSKKVLKAAKGTVKAVTGLLKKSLGRKVKTFRNTGTVVGIVGARRNFRQAVGTITRGKNKGQTRYADPAKIISFVESGTRPHSTAVGAQLARRGKAAKGQTGRIHPGAKAHPFLGPAANSVKSTVQSEMSDLIARGVEEAAKGVV